MPAPAVWVEAFDLGDLCAAVWFDETHRAAWTVSQPAASGGPSIEAYGIEASFESYRDDAYRLEPTGIAVACSVGSQADLTCHYYDCTDLVRTMPPPHCRHGPAPRSRTRSAIQRTHSFVSDRPWWRSGILQGGAIHVCLQRDGEILCYRLERGVERPAPISAPALSALRDVRDISGAGAAACAVLGDGSVYCWGAPLVAEPSTEEARDAERVDPASAWTPRRIEGIPPAVQVSVGLRNACARTADGRVFCWGDPRCLIDQVPAEDTAGSASVDAPTQ